MAFVDKIEIKDGFITDSLLIKKVEKIAKEHNLEDFKASLGWLSKFKTRHNLSLKKFHGETFLSDKKDFKQEIREIEPLVELYGKENSYNMDETGIFYKFIPPKGVCSKPRRGFKNFKDGVSIMLCSNTDDTYKLNPLIIGKYKNQGASVIFPFPKIFSTKIQKELG